MDSNQGRTFPPVVFLKLLPRASTVMGVSKVAVESVSRLEFFLFFNFLEDLLSEPLS
jgi:hypothetical protein